MRGDDWAAVPQQLQEKLCDAFPVGLTCCSWVAASSSGLLLLHPAAGGGDGDGGAAAAGETGSGGGSDSSRRLGLIWEAFTGSSMPPAAAVAAVHVLDALGRGYCIGGVEAPVLLHICGTSSSSSCGLTADAAEVVAGAAALCVDLLLLLAEDDMQQPDLDTLAEKLAVKVAASLARDQLTDMQQQQLGPGDSQEGSTTAVLQQWASRVDAIVSQPAALQQQHDKLAHLQMLLSLG